jgi:predicted ATPase
VLLTSFVGRERDVKSLVDALGQFRVVTVIGPGGIGKTRLALQAAGETSIRYRHGAWFCEPTPVADRKQVAEAVAGCLGLRVQPGEPVAATVVAFLHHKRLLLVLDNCEHVLDEAGLIAEAIAHTCPGVTVLATRREALVVDGERLWPVGSLPVPDPDATLEEAAATPAVRLFTDRARAVRPGFNLSNEERPPGPARWPRLWRRRPDGLRSEVPGHRPRREARPAHRARKLGVDDCDVGREGRGGHVAPPRSG